ncbi:hypothetical protein AGMMS49543_20860 [Betaproteobacteria bacterium]|nr:hypothetical protein AGMMS49543_20860 [Betaproteobacteria bacterium]
MITISGTGYVSTEVKVDMSKKGTRYIRFRLRTKTSQKDVDGKPVWEFFTVFVGGKNDVAFAEKYVRKGDLLEFAGTWEPRQYKGASDYQIKADHIGKAHSDYDAPSKTLTKEDLTPPKPKPPVFNDAVDAHEETFEDQF